VKRKKRERRKRKIKKNILKTKKEDGTKETEKNGRRK
jgi:hypothetical protein